MTYFLKGVFYSRFVKISRVGLKISKTVVFWPNFPIFGLKNFFRGWGSRLMIFQMGGGVVKAGIVYGSDLLSFNVFRDRIYFRYGEPNCETLSI